MKGGGDDAKMKESSLYRDMFKDIIKNQIQSLIEQLANAGEESVLLTANIIQTTEFADETIIGSELGQTFIHSHENLKSLFQVFCAQNYRKKDFNFSAISGKRKHIETNGEVVNDSCIKAESIMPGPMCKKNRTSSLSSSDSRDTSIADSNPRVSLEAVQTANNAPAIVWKDPLSGAEYDLAQFQSVLLPKYPPTRQFQSSNILQDTYRQFIDNVPKIEPGPCGLDQDGILPKGHTRCSLCQYHSNFKANVLRHERSVHGLHLDGACSPSVQYTCAVCSYKSLFRSNVMRHERNVHKLISSAMDLENRKIPISQASDFTLKSKNQTGFVSGTVEHLSQFMAAGNQFLVQSSNQSDQYIVNEDINTTGSNFAGNENQDSAKQNIKNENLDAAEQFVDNGCHICNYCQEMLPTIEQLRNHIAQIHVNSDECKCERCGQTFGNLFDLQGHMATHNTLKHEKCMCGKTFQYKTSLIRHQKRCEHSRTNQEKSDQDISQGVNEERISHDIVERIEHEENTEERNSNQDVVKIEHEQEVEERNSNTNCVGREHAQEVEETNIHKDVLKIENEQEEHSIMNKKSVQETSQHVNNIEKNSSESDCDMAKVKHC